MIDAPPLPDARLADASRPVAARRRVTLLLGVVTFLCGAVAGAGLTSVFSAHTRSSNRPPMGKRILEEMKSTLALSDVQSTQVEKILEENQVRVEAIRKEMAPRYSAEFERMNASMKAVLTPEQQQKWDIRSKEIREKYRMRPHRGGSSKGPNSDGSKANSAQPGEQKKGAAADEAAKPASP